MARTLYRTSDDGGRHERAEMSMLRALAKARSDYYGTWQRFPSRFAMNTASWADLSSTFPTGSGRGVARIFYDMTPVIDDTLGNDEFEVLD